MIVFLTPVAQLLRWPLARGGLKEIAPGVRRVAVVRDPTLVSGTGQLAAIQAVAPSFGVELTQVDARDAGEIELGAQSPVPSSDAW
jgi:hypothetical protein